MKTLVIGITGGIATGKSLVTRLLQEQGVVVFSADEAARAVLTPGSPLLDQIAHAFGADMLLPDGSLDRTRLGKRIFADQEAREQLNRILHPPILRLMRAWMEAARDDLPPGSLVAVEVPLLYETRLTPWFDRVLVVSASETTQMARLRVRNHLEETEARQRLQAQWPLAEKVALADDVVFNDGDREALAEQLQRHLFRWKETAAEQEGKAETKKAGP